MRAIARGCMMRGGSGGLGISEKTSKKKEEFSKECLGMGTSFTLGHANKPPLSTFLLKKYGY